VSTIAVRGVVKGMKTAGTYRALALACAVTVLAAQPAAAQRCVAPPGTAAIEQYCETVPDASGGRPADSGGVADATASNPVPAETIRQLDASGESGRDLSRVLRAGTSPARARGTARARRSAPRARRSAPRRARPADAAPPAANPLDAVGSAFSRGGTVGDGFAWILLAIAAGMGGAAWLRHSRGRAG
jgi:hypothetical protein